MAEKTINTRQKQKYDTSVNWTTNNPILFAGEIGIESDTNKFKIGNGTSTWNELDYAGGSEVTLYSTTGQNTDGAMTQKATTDKLELLQSNIPTMLSDLAEDNTHRTVTDTEKSTWNNKSNFSGSYNDLTDKPTISTINVDGQPQSTINFNSDPQTQINSKSSIKTQTFTTISSLKTFVENNFDKIIDFEFYNPSSFGGTVTSQTQITINNSGIIFNEEFSQNSPLYPHVYYKNMRIVKNVSSYELYFIGSDNMECILNLGIRQLRAKLTTINAISNEFYHYEWTSTLPDDVGTWTVTYYE